MNNLFKKTKNMHNKNITKLIAQKILNLKEQEWSLD